MTRAAARSLPEWVRDCTEKLPGLHRQQPRAGDRRVLLVDAEIDDVPAADPTRVGSRRTLAYLGVCLVLIGLNLRTVFSSFAAVLPEVTADAGCRAGPSSS